MFGRSSIDDASRAFKAILTNLARLAPDLYTMIA